MSTRPFSLAATTALVWSCLNQVLFAAEQTVHEHTAASFSLFLLVKPLGVSTLTLLLLTFLAGLFRRKLGRRFLRVHKTLAFLTVALALFHGILVLILF